MSGLRRLGLGLATLFGPRPRGYFIPYRLAGDGAAPAFSGPYPAMAELLDAHVPDFQDWLDEIERQADALRAIGAAHASSAEAGEASAVAPAPRWNQDWFPRLDAAMAYCFVRRRRPSRIVEIGSGHSTRFMARAVADGGFDCAIVAIDPAPRAAVHGLGVQHLPQTLQQAGRAAIAALAPGDVLFIDSSHVLMPGSDVDILFNRVLPDLPRGAVVHVHDVFLPDDYPEQWRWRGYNEQLGLATLLQGGRYRPIFASHYVATRLAARLRAGVLAELPLVAGAIESSLWLVKEG